MRLSYFVLIAISQFACKGHLPILISGENKVVKQEINSDSRTASFLSPWKDSVEKAMHTFVGLADTAWLSKDRTGNLGQLIADAGLEKAKQVMLDSFGIMPHCAIYNFGGIRNSLSKDSIFTRNIFECIPFQNEIVVLKITGVMMDSILHLIAIKNGEPVAGILMSIQNKNWVSAEIANLSFDSRREYWITVNDFMANGGDGYSILKNAAYTFKTGIPWRDAVSELIKSETSQKGFIKKRNISRIFIKN